jgi:hypothetical protein
MMPLVMTLVVGLGRSEHKSRKEQSDRSSHDSQTIHGWSSCELVMHSGDAALLWAFLKRLAAPLPA